MSNRKQEQVVRIQNPVLLAIVSPLMTAVVMVRQPGVDVGINLPHHDDDNLR